MDAPVNAMPSQDDIAKVMSSQDNCTCNGYPILFTPNSTKKMQKSVEFVLTNQFKLRKEDVLADSAEEEQKKEE